MQTIAVYVNDAEHARQVLHPLLDPAVPTRWVVVACAPVLRRHVGRWLSQAARRQWRERWASEMFQTLDVAFVAAGLEAPEHVIARRPLAEVTERLRQRHGDLRLLDARSVRLGQSVEPIMAGQPTENGRGAWPAALAATGGLSAMLALAD